MISPPSAVSQAFRAYGHLSCTLCGGCFVGAPRRTVNVLFRRRRQPTGGEALFQNFLLILQLAKHRWRSVTVETCAERAVDNTLSRRFPTNFVRLAELCTIQLEDHHANARLKGKARREARA